MHPAWKPRGPEWVTLAPGVQWLIRPLTGEVQAYAMARVAREIDALRQGRQTLDDLGFEDEDLGVLADLNVMAGLSQLLAAVFMAERLVEGWRGMVDPGTGEDVPVSPEAIRAALRIGTPEGGYAMLQPFMAWLDQPRVPVAADQRRLRALAKWEYGGGLEFCKGCDLAEAACAHGGSDAGARCPRAVNAPQTEPGQAALEVTHASGVWRRAGLEGQITGLDYAACLDLIDALDVRNRTYLDRGATVRCLKAIEAGALEAAAEKAAAQKA